MRAEKAEIEGAVLRDKEEIRALQRNLKDAVEASTVAKDELEKFRKEARQQKGLLAVSKKQLSNAQSEHERVQAGLAIEKADLNKINDEIAETEAAVQTLSIASSKLARAVSPANVALPETPDRIASPALSQKSNNPFGRFTSSLSETPSPATLSPFAIQGEITEEPQPLKMGEGLDPFEAAYGLSEPMIKIHEPKGPEDPKTFISIANAATPIDASSVAPEVGVDVLAPSPREKTR